MQNNKTTTSHKMRIKAQKITVDLKLLLTCCFLFCTISVLSCKSFFRPPDEALKEDLHNYQKDLLFDRYEHAAQRVHQSKRSQYLAALRSIPGFKYAEIEFLSQEPCGDLAEDENSEHCVMVRSALHWYTDSSPNIRQTQVLERWEYDESDAAWYLVQQTDVSAP
ncbi:MAG: hypothetical protein WC966_12465 [Bradymonadales bacterium]|jgi:hypothetical protein